MSSGHPSSAIAPVAAEEVANPLLPMEWEVLVGGIGLALLLYTVVALVSVTSSRTVTGLATAVWVLVVLAFPVLGATAWFLWRARQPTPYR